MGKEYISLKKSEDANSGSKSRKNFPCPLFVILSPPKTIISTKEKENTTLPTYIIPKLCSELRREVDAQCYCPCPSYITEALILRWLIL